MGTFFRVSKISTVVFFAAALIVAQVFSVVAKPITVVRAQEVPVLTTDKPDYAPGETATIFGSLFAPVESFLLKIFGGTADTYTESIQSVASDGEGSFTTTYHLDNVFRPLYTVVASTISGVELTRMTFADQVAVDFKQCANDRSEGAGSCDWINSILQASNSAYAEGMSVPQRLLYRGIGNGSHTISFKYSYTKGGIHAYDFITSKNQGNGDFTPGITTFNNCQGLSGPDLTACNGLISANTFTNVAIPNDAFDSKDSAPATGTGSTQTAKEIAYETAYGPRAIQMFYEGSLSSPSISPITHDVAANGDTGDSDAQVTINFTLSSCTSGCNVMLYFDGHLAVSGNDNTTGSNWGSGLGSGNISGGPYHIKNVQLDGSGGSLDNQIQGASILVPSNASITIVKDAVPDNAQDFSFTTTGTGLSAFSLDDDADGTLSNTQTFNSLAPGTYSVTEGAVSGWNSDGGVCSDGSPASAISLEASENVTCTFTNTLQTAHLTLVKTVMNDNGGIAVVSNFPLFVNAVPVVSGVSNELNAGNYTASETNLPGYTASVWGGHCAANGSVTLAPGDNKTCTITNNDQPGHLIVHKVTLPANDQTMFSVTLDADPVLGSATQNLSTNASVDYTVNAGVYSVDEANLAGWDETGNTCVDVAVALGETEHCTITNTKRGHVIIQKDAVSDSDQEFTFNNDFGNGNNPTFILVDDSTSGLPSYNAEILPGTYVVTENSVPGWKPDGTTCDMGETVDNIDVGPGETVTCKFTNEKLAKITVVKNAIGGDATFDFMTTGVGFGPSAQLTTVAGTASEAFANLDPDLTYTIAETSVPAGWAMTNAICDNGDPINNITPNAGEEITCTFTNNKPVAQIDVTPLNATNEIGDDHVVTAIVQTHNGDGVWGPAADNTLVTFTLVNNTANAVFVGGNTCNTNTGSCSVTINSTSIGGVDIHAAATPIALSVSLTVETDGVGANGANGHKNYVDASIAIGDTATNNITDPHTFTITVTQVPGTATPAVTANITPSVLPAPGSYNTTCGAAVPFLGNTATCTVTINNNTPDVFTATASASLTIGGAVLTRSTDGLASNSGPAIKTYIAGALEVTKIVPDLSGIVNYTSISDTFTVTVTGPSYPGGQNIVFTLTNGILQAPATITLSPLIPGDYTVTEADAGAEWTEVVAISPVSVIANATSSATVTNTYVPSSLEINKVVALNGYLFPDYVDLDFTVNVTGPSYPAPYPVIINVVNGIPTNSPQTLLNLIPGDYTATEVNPGIMWEVFGNGNVAVSAGNEAEKTITNAIKLPSTNISLTPSVWETEPGQNVTLTITDTNNGQVPISNPSVQLLTNNVLTVPQPIFVSESGTVNGIIDVGETWTWTWQGVISENTVFTVNGIGTDPLGAPVNGPTYSTETESATVRVIGTTRTIGFWQTHTGFTSYIFQNLMNGSTTVGSAPSKGDVTNIQLAGQSQLFGGFYAPIAKKTTGAKRTPIDQARIQMLQQLLAAKLNCAAFGCSAATTQLIVDADAAYAAGTNKNLILSLAGQLDTFNNSGDTNAIPAELPATGKATPKTSQSYADTAFWNNP